MNSFVYIYSCMEVLWMHMEKEKSVLLIEHNKINFNLLYGFGTTRKQPRLLYLAKKISVNDYLCWALTAGNNRFAYNHGYYN